MYGFSVPTVYNGACHAGVVCTQQVFVRQWNSSYPTNMCQIKERMSKFLEATGKYPSWISMRDCLLLATNSS